jgi:hypothetical protein
LYALIDADLEASIAHHMPSSVARLVSLGDNRLGIFIAIAHIDIARG